MSYGTETIRYRGQRLWVTMPQHIRNTQSINEFKTHIKIGMSLTVHADYVGYLCRSSCDWIFLVVRMASSDIHY